LSQEVIRGTGYGSSRRKVSGGDSGGRRAVSSARRTGDISLTTELVTEAHRLPSGDRKEGGWSRYIYYENNKEIPRLVRENPKA